MASRRRLGHSEVEISPIGLGCWQFSGGHGMVGGFWPALSVDETNGIVRAALDGGINWFDTAEAYGKGRSESALAQALDAAGRKRGDVVIATKWFPAFRRASSIAATIDDRRRHLDGHPIDLHQVHHWSSLSSVSSQMNAMADLVDAGKVRTVGVSNFSAAGMRRAHVALAARGHPLVANQVLYSLLDRRIEGNGILDAAKALGVTIIAYSPLAQGLLSGKFHDDPSIVRGRPGPRKWMPAFRRRGLDRSRPLVDALRSIADAHGATPAQVALGWLVHFHGDTVVAIPGATKREHAEDCAAAMDLELTRRELERIDGLSQACAKLG